MRAHSLMSKPVYTVRADQTVQDAIQIMLARRISGLPVVNAAGEIVGVVTEGDLLRRAELGTEKDHGWRKILIGAGHLAAEYIKSHGRKVEDLMTAPAVTIDPDATLPEIVDLMEKHNLKRLPVVSGKRVVGIVSRANLLRAFAHLPAKVTAVLETDVDIRSKVLDVLNQQPWSALNIDAIARSGEVHLYGSVFSEAVRKAAEVAAENVQGVKRVVNNILVGMPERY
jgi:CBS domain-containing protein